MPGDLPPRSGVRYVATLDIGITNDRTVLTVMHAKQAPGAVR
jgi:hypothetical protein